MPYNEALVARIRPLLTEKTAFEEKKMFGGVVFMVRRNMCCGVHKDHMVLRLGPKAEQALQLEHCRVFDITGRPMQGWVMVNPEGYASDAFLHKWVDQCFEFVMTLPAK